MMQKWNDGFTFLKQPLGTEYEQVMAKVSEFLPVEIPHDYLIYDTENLYEDSTGWYRKVFEGTKPGEDETVILVFDGVYMDSTVYVNDHVAKEWKYGYSSFEVDITKYLKDGENSVVVCARHQAPNSRWYSGAGLYRNVWLRHQKGSYIANNGVYIHSEKKGEDYELIIETEICRKATEDKADNNAVGDTADGCIAKESLLLTVDHRLVSLDGTEEYAFRRTETEAEYELVSEEMTRNGDGVLLDRKKYVVKKPFIWDVEHPYLYRVYTTLRLNNDRTVCDSVVNTVGFRTIEISPNQGFFLNGRKVKLNGVCEHHDLGALGAAFHTGAQRRKYRILKEMGVNAVRYAHNMPARECLELADEMGLLVMNEAYDMWERPKTPYDYARFFNEWHARDMESFVKRDRNHPSMIMWSIGNEIYDTHADAKRGSEIINDLCGLVKQFDPYHNAYITFGSNYLPWENTQECAKLLEAVGYNYSEKYYEEHHEKYRDWVIYGSETSSIVYSRGIYHFPLKACILSDDDEQCSALINSITSWGARSIENCICDDRDMEFSMGQFLWTGSDYIGEPTPYHTKNSYFGQIDTAGFPKDAYYVYQAEWTDYKVRPMVHVFPYWDFNEGQLIDIRVCSNAPYVELFVNGESLGQQELNHKVGSGKHILADYQAVYKPGSICAVAYDEEGNELCREEHVSFKDSKEIVLKADKTVMSLPEEDILFVEIGTIDEDGHPVENATDYVHVEVTGPARLVGLDNGDSTDYDSYKGSRRKLFSGKLLAMVKAYGEAGDVCVRVTGQGLQEASLTVKSMGAEEGAFVPAEDTSNDSMESIVPVRRISLCCNTGTTLTPDSGECRVRADIFPAGATDREVAFRAVNDSGVTTNLVKVTQEGNEAIVKPLGDGRFRLRCVSKSGTDKIHVISELDFCTEGFGEAYLNPYDFISGSLYADYRGNVAAGNERGVASARDGETIIIYEDIDFGIVGSDEITIPIFALSDDAYPIEIYEGVKAEGGELLAAVVYQKPSIWNVYQEATYTLSRKLTGIRTISFVLHQKVHIKGFFFKKYERAFMKLGATDADRIYGDSYEIVDSRVEGIGNNVSLTFENMEFGEEGTDSILIRGRAVKGDNTIHVRFSKGEEAVKQIVEFAMCKEYKEQQFTLENMQGTWDVTFMFMPGSYFDFDSFCFIRSVR